MQRSGLVTIVCGMLIVAGLVVSVVENQAALEGIGQGNGKVGTDEAVTVEAQIDEADTSRGIFAVQVMEPGRATISASVLDPSGIEIASRAIGGEGMEEEFDVRDTGTYQLIIRGSGEEVYVAGAIGPLPDTERRVAVSAIALSIIVIGMGGLVVTGLLGIRGKKRSV